MPMLNADAYRNLNRLKEEYRNLAEEGWFVKGTDWRAIVHHEFGHIVAKLYRVPPMEIAQEITQLSAIETLQFVQEGISEYAGNAFDGSEIISEVFADISTATADDFSRRFYSMIIEITREGERYGRR